MGPITSETINKWTQENKWMQVNEMATVNGRQVTFLTPYGNLVIIMYDLKGNFFGVGQPVPVPQSPIKPSKLVAPR